MAHQHRDFAMRSTGETHEPMRTAIVAHWSVPSFGNITIRGETKWLNPCQTERKCTRSAMRMFRKLSVCACGYVWMSSHQIGNDKVSEISVLIDDRRQTCAFSAVFKTISNFKSRPFDISIRSKMIMLCVRDASVCSSWFIHSMVVWRASERASTRCERYASECVSKCVEKA